VTATDAALVAAAVAFLDVCGPALVDAAGSFTCDEADQLHELFTVFGHTDRADVFLSEHAAADEHGDRHYLPPVP
jgi:hypothetical protein